MQISVFYIDIFKHFFIHVFICKIENSFWIFRFKKW